jgi:hypothetical protein
MRLKMGSQNANPASDSLDTGCLCKSNVRGVQMFVPLTFSRRAKAGSRRAGICLALLLAVLAGNPVLARAGEGSSGPARAASAKPNPKPNPKGAPWIQLPLSDLGFPGVSSTFLAAGTSMLTVHFVDEKHLLLTFSLRNLIPRIEGDPPEHDDRVVAAELIDLPSGRIAARTEWRMHDHGRYLWSLGHGRFLIRLGDELSTIEPMARSGAGQAFVRTVFPTHRGRPTVVIVSPDGGLVTLETVVAVGTRSKATVVFGDQDTAEANAVPTRTLIDFIRIRPGKEEPGKHEDLTLDATAAGAVQSSQPLFLPIDSDGYLWAEQTDSNRWSITFDEFGGKTLQLGAIDSTCMPRLQMLDRGEFVAMTCHGGDDHVHIASFGLDGKETWEENLGDFGAPTFAFAPPMARFAISHISEASLPPMASVNDPEPEAVAHQEVRVYQNASGDLLLRAECTPVFKTAENFDLSPEGTEVALIRNGAVAVYKLPELGKEDREDMAEVEKFSPPATTAPVKLPRLTVPIRIAAAGKPVEGDVAVAKGKVTDALAVPSEPESAPAPRKPPTLLKPGEKPDFGKANAPNTTQEPQ